MEQFDEFEITQAEIEYCEVAELIHNNPDLMNQNIVMETENDWDEIRAIEELMGIDTSIFEVS